MTAMSRRSRWRVCSNRAALGSTRTCSRSISSHTTQPTRSTTVPVASRSRLLRERSSQEECPRPCASRADGISTLPADNSPHAPPKLGAHGNSPRGVLKRTLLKLGLRTAAHASLTGAQQTVAQLGLLLGTWIPLTHVRQLIECTQTEQLEKLCGR